MEVCGHIVRRSLVTSELGCLGQGREAFVSYGRLSRGLKDACPSIAMKFGERSFRQRAMVSGVGDEPLRMACRLGW